MKGKVIKDKQFDFENLRLMALMIKFSSQNRTFVNFEINFSMSKEPLKEI